MKNIIKTKLVAMSLATSALFGFSGLAHADPFSWTFTDTNLISNSGAAQVVNSNTSLGGLTVDYSAWANTGSGGYDGTSTATFTAQTLRDYGSYNLGLTTDSGDSWCGGVRESYGCNGYGSPNHAIDNNGAQEFVLFEFSTEVVLNSVAIGWPNSNGGDTDMTIMAYTGPGALPDLTGLSSAAILAGSTNDLFYIEHLPDVPADSGTPEPYGNNASFNSSDVASKFWMIGAYNQHLGGNLSTQNDYMKLAMLTGYTPSIPDPEPPTPTPEPAPLLMLAASLLGLRFAKKRKA